MWLGTPDVATATSIVPLSLNFTVPLARTNLHVSPLPIPRSPIYRYMYSISSKLNL